jgi:hypothetical protein
VQVLRRGRNRDYQTSILALRYTFELTYLAGRLLKERVTRIILTFCSTLLRALSITICFRSHGRRCTAFSGGLRGALQQRSSEQRHRLHHAEGHARRASAGDSGRAGSKVGSSEGTAEESPPAGRVTDETDYFRFADHPRAISNFGKHRFSLFALRGIHSVRGVSTIEYGDHGYGAELRRARESLPSDI